MASVHLLCTSQHRSMAGLPAHAPDGGWRLRAGVGGVAVAMLKGVSRSDFGVESAYYSKVLTRLSLPGLLYELSQQCSPSNSRNSSCLHVWLP